MNNLFFNICMALIVAIAGIVTKTLLPYLEEKRAEVEAKLRNTRWSWAVDIVDAVVRAVEQTVEEDIHGEDKKRIAIKYIEKLLNDNGIALTYDEINTLVEAAVNTMNSGFISVETEGSVPDETEPVEADPVIASQLSALLAAEDEE